MSEQPQPPHIDADGQVSLFPPSSPLPGRDPKADEQQERAALEEAKQFALDNLVGVRGSAVEFVHTLVERFGTGVKLVLVDVVRELAEDTTLGRFDREYIATELAAEKIQDVLRGGEQIRPARENTLDELFARSSAYRSSGKFVEAITFVSKLCEYAPFNNMLVYLQRPTAKYWATASHWRKAFGRKVKADARPLIMLQPMGPIMLAYDVEDTEGPPLPWDLLEPFAVEGGLDPEVYEMTLRNCDLAGITVKLNQLRPQHAGSAFNAPNGAGVKAVVELNESHDMVARYATLCHELAHIYLGHLGADLQEKLWVSRLGLTRNQRELEAEAVAYMVCYRARLTTKSAEYLAGYLPDPAALAGVSIDMVMKVAGLIERMGKEVMRPRQAGRRKQVKRSEQLSLTTEIILG